VSSSLCVLVVVVLLSDGWSLGAVPACSFNSLKEVQDYKMLECGVTLAGGGS
jgi:hypothetical protein